MGLTTPTLHGFLQIERMMMTYEELKQHVMDYFSDKSRPAHETREDLNALADECLMLAETIADED